MTSSATETPSVQEEGAVMSSTNTRTTATRLEAIGILLNRYRQNQLNEQQQKGTTPASVSGYYVHPALSYVPDQYGGICGRVTTSIKKNEILLVIPQQERISFATIGPTLQPKSLYTHHLLQILRECKQKIESDFPLIVDSNNIITALLIMYCWKRQSDDFVESSSSSSNGSIKSKTNLELYMESWPSNEDLLTSYFTKEDRANMLQGTCSEYYLKERARAQDIIVDIILNVLNSYTKQHNIKNNGKGGPSSSLASKFCNDTSHDGFAKVFALAWKIVDSRCHTGLEGNCFPCRD